MDGQGGGGFLPGWSWLLWLHIRETNGLRGEKKKQAPFLSHLLVTYYEKCVCVCVSVYFLLFGKGTSQQDTQFCLRTYVVFFSFVGVGENHEK